MCYTQFRMSQVLSDTSILFSKESDQQDEDIDDQREIQRERDFDRIQQSIETDSGNTT
jgi:mevalonate pyrophosphate decarboxylase